MHFLRYEDTSLYVFAGSEPIHAPMNLLQYDKLEALMNTLRPMFDYIVLDTPPCCLLYTSIWWTKPLSSAFLKMAMASS